MHRELSNRVESMLCIELSERLSDAALASLSCCYVSLHNLVVTHDPDTVRVGRRYLSSALDSLYRICVRRCRRNQPLARRSALTPVLHMIVHMPMRVVDMAKSRECAELMWRLADEWIRKHPAAGEDDAAAEDVSVCGVLRCIAALYAHVSQSERMAEREYVWYRHRVGEWAGELESAECREGITSYQALCRLEILSRNSALLSDSRYDAHIVRALALCSRSVLGTVRSAEAQEDAAAELHMLCEAMMWGIGAAEVPMQAQMQAVDDIAAAADRLAAQYPAGSEQWLNCMAVMLDCECLKLMQLTQLSTINHSA